ncbi:MAG: MFS transporter [Patescibacteria group bacterium]|jgi:MFS family permease
MVLSKRRVIFEFWPFFIYKFLKGACFITSITFFLYFREKGIDFFKASFLLSILFLLPIFFEIITGAIADTFGRKFSVLTGIAGEILILLAIIYTANYFLLIGFFVLWGIITTFTTGADDAWAIELAPDELKEEYLDNFYPLSSSFYSVGMIVAGLLSGWLLFFSNNQAVWVARLIIIIITLLVLSFTKENFKKEKDGSSKFFQLKASLKKGYEFFIINANTKNIILGEFFATIALVGIGSVAMQKYLLDSGLKESNWGLVYSLSAIAGIFIPLLAIGMTKKFSNQKIYLIIVYASQIILYLSASLLLNPLFAVLLIFLHNSLEDAFNPVNSAFFQKEIPSKIRATLGSLRAASLGLAAFSGTILGGFLTNYSSGQASIFGLALLIIPAIIFYAKIKTPALQN